jgi:hypothetical protein
VTTGNSDGDASVTIGRLEAVYVIPRGHPSPDGLRARMDALAREQLAWSCRRILAHALDPKDPSIWFIRRLSVGLTLDAAAFDNEPLANAWGAQLSKSVVETFARGADNESVVHFPDRAAYLAQFVADLAEGRAWDKWYYEGSLRSLPVGGAIAQALAREPEHLPATLRRLMASGSLENVLGALDEPGARRIYEACFEPYQPSSLSERVMADMVLAAWPAAFPMSRGSNLTGSVAALRLVAATLHSASAIDASRELRDAIDHLCAFAELLNKVQDPEMLALKLAAGDLAGAAEMAHSFQAGHARDSLHFIEQAAENDIAWMRKLLETIRPTVATAVRPLGGIDAGYRSFVTSFGGVFLFLPSLLDLGIEEIIAEAPDSKLPKEETQRALRLILFLKLVGADRAREAANDPALLLAAGLDKLILPESFASLCELGTEETNQECLRRLADLLFRKGYVNGRYLSLELVTTDELGKVLLLRDLESDAWLWAASCHSPAVRTQTLLRAALEDLATLLEGSEGYLLIGPETSEFLDAEAISAIRRPIVWLEPQQQAGLKPIQLDSGGTERTAWVTESSPVPLEELRKLSNVLHTLRPPEADLDYLTLASFHDSRNAILPNTAFDLVWSLAARMVLRAFARKLMGFGQSSLKYLRENFFSGISSIHVQGNAISVELPACPLAVVLNMAGVNGLTYSVPWLDNAQVKLSLPSN